MVDFALYSCDRSVAIHCGDEQSAALVRTAFGSMLVDRAPRSPVIRRYRIERTRSGKGFRVATDGKAPVRLPDAGELLFFLDKSITIAVQLERPDLFFMHAAVVSLGQRAVVLPAPSGSGKSTLALALAHGGFDYLSDELAPIDARRLAVHPFPHALCLKTSPPAPYRLPTTVLRAGKRLYIAPDSLGVRTRTTPLPVAAFIFLRRGPGKGPKARRITSGAAAAHVVANALNALAHPEAGLDVAAVLSQAAPCFQLDNTSLTGACEAVRTILQADRL